MSTYMPKAGDITRNWYVLDAAGKPMGRVAAQAAILLRGKHKPTLRPMPIAATMSLLSTLTRPFSQATSSSRRCITIIPAISATSKRSSTAR